MATGPPGEPPDVDALLRQLREWVQRSSRLLLTSIVLLAIGFLGSEILHGDLFAFLLVIGVILFVVYLLRRFPRLLGREQVLEQWNVLIDHADGKAGAIFEQTQQHIVNTKAPDVKTELRDVSPGIIRGILGRTRPFLVVSHTTNSNLKPYRMYLNARDYGTNLQVSWYLVHQPGLWRRILILLLLIPILNLLILPFYLVIRLTRAREAGFLNLDLFDLQDLTAYVTNAHHCLLDAVDKLLLELGHDPSKIDRQSKGFLGIS